jgi:LuxR family transcriptional regulator
MNNWQEDLINLLLVPEPSSEMLFLKIEGFAAKLGFDHLSFGFQVPYPVTEPKIILLDNYPGAWRERYGQAGYLRTDPTVIHGRRSTCPIVWSSQTFANNPKLWNDVQEHGIHTGWAQSTLDSNGTASMLTLCRSSEPLTADELEAKEMQMRWLVQLAHVGLSRSILSEQVLAYEPLTPREREVLQWSADGKSAQDIATIFSLSKSAIDFHLKNIMNKLQTSNKTAAVARAALFGLLS